jgi:hypothetical protein
VRQSRSCRDQTPAEAGWCKLRGRKQLDEVESVSGRQHVAFNETGMHLLRRPLKKIENIQNLRKIKKCWKLSEKRTKSKISEKC